MAGVRTRIVVSVLLILSPLLLLFWILWYNHVFSPIDMPQNRAALTELHDKSEICAKNIFNDHIPLCAEVDDYCRTPKGTQNQYCAAWLSASKPFRWFFWVSAALGLIAFTTGAIVLTITLAELYARMLNRGPPKPVEENDPWFPQPQTSAQTKKTTRPSSTSRKPKS